MFKRFIVNEETEKSEGKIIYYYEYDKEYDRTIIVGIHKGVNDIIFYSAMDTKGQLEEDEIHYEFFNDENINEGLSSDNLEDLKEYIEDIEEIVEEYKDELIRL